MHRLVWQSNLRAKLISRHLSTEFHRLLAMEMPEHQMVEPVIPLGATLGGLSVEESRHAVIYVVALGGAGQVRSKHLSRGWRVDPKQRLDGRPAVFPCFELLIQPGDEC